MEVELGENAGVQNFVSIPAGSYVCKVDDVRVGKTRAGDARWSFRLVVDVGEYAGRQAAWDSLVFSERGLNRVRFVLEALGLPHRGTVQLEPNDLQDRRALVDVHPVDYEAPSGETIRRNEVPYSGYRRLDAETGGPIDTETTRATEARPPTLPREDPAGDGDGIRQQAMLPEPGPPDELPF